jgi:putative endonuclease
MAKHNEIGHIGEDISATFLMKHGFTILEKNYRTKVGEIDIVALKNTKLHFVEVKSVSVRDLHNIKNIRISPADHLTDAKWSNIVRSIEIYQHHKSISQDVHLQVDLACVYIQEDVRQGRVEIIQNITKEKR